MTDLCLCPLPSPRIRIPTLLISVAQGGRTPQGPAPLASGWVHPMGGMGGGLEAGGREGELGASINRVYGVATAWRSTVSLRPRLPWGGSALSCGS